MRYKEVKEVKYLITIKYVSNLALSNVKFININSRFLGLKTTKQVNLKPSLDYIYKPTYTLRLNQYVVNKSIQLKPAFFKEKYSFFNNIVYKKSILRQAAKLTIYKTFKKYSARSNNILSYRITRLATQSF